MTITFEDMEPQAREILNLPEGSDEATRGRALIHALVAASQTEFNTPQERTHAIFNAYHADDILTCVGVNAQGETKNGTTVLDRVGYTPEKSKFFMLVKADNLSRAVATEHGQAVIKDIASQMAEIERLEDPTAMHATAFERATSSHGVSLPTGFSNFLKRHTNHSEQVARLSQASALTESVNNQLQGLLNTGEAILQAEGWQPPLSELAAHAV